MTALLETVDGRGVARLVLNRPEIRNAFDDALIAALTEAFTRLGAAADVRAIVLAAAGTAFSAGADLGWMQRMAGYGVEENRADALALARMLEAIDSAPKPTLALVQGPAFGGGVGLVAACDIALAAEGAVFSLSEVRLGLIPAVISPYVVQAMGARACRRVFLTGERFDAATAAATGLISAVVPADDLEAAGATVIDDLLAGAPQAQAEAKDLIRLCETTPLSPALREETARRIADRRASAEGREGIAAFLGRRRPTWTAPKAAGSADSASLVGDRGRSDAGGA